MQIYQKTQPTPTFANSLAPLSPILLKLKFKNVTAHLMLGSPIHRAMLSAPLSVI